MGIKQAGAAAKKTPFELRGDFHERYRDWTAYKRGFLAKAGGLHDQDADWLEDMITLDCMYTDEYNELANAQKKPRGRGR